MATIDDFQKDGLHEDIRAFQIELARKFPDYRVTSGLRPGAKTKQGRASRHATGEALDIRFRKDIRDYLWDTPEGLSLLEKHGLGLIDESTPEQLKKTRGTGAHLHIGKDTKFVSDVRNRYQQLTGSKTPMTDTYVTPYMNTSSTQPQVSITNNISDLPPIKETPIFTEDNKKEEVVQEDTDKVQMQQELNEYNLKQEIQNRFAKTLMGGQQPIVQLEEEQIQQAPVKTIGQIYGEASQIVGQAPLQQGGFIKDNRGQWAHPFQNTEIASPSISMQNVPYPVLGISKETGEQRLMQPDSEHFFENTSNVLEIPQLQDYFKQKYK